MWYVSFSNISCYLYFSLLFMNSTKKNFFAVYSLICYYFKNLIAEELDGRADEVAGISNWLNLSVSDTVLKAITDMGYFSITFKLCEL